jgi:hypothetical protein
MGQAGEDIGDAVYVAVNPHTAGRGEAPAPCLRETR